MVFKLTGPLGPVYIPSDGKIVLGRRTHQNVHRDKFCSRNQSILSTSPQAHAQHHSLTASHHHNATHHMPVI
jgi:hypothetical protein